jgi:hypothetical protein
MCFLRGTNVILISYLEVYLCVPGARGSVVG